MIDPTVIASFRDRYNQCFACGQENPIGLHIDPIGGVGDNVVEGTFRPRPEFAGFEKTLHGGVISTALDEISAWCAMVYAGKLVFTATLEIRFRKPASTESTFLLRGRLVEQRGRRFMIESEMLDDDVVVASSKGVFVEAFDLVENPESGTQNPD